MLFLDNDAIAALIDPARFVAAQDDAYRAFAARQKPVFEGN